MDPAAASSSSEEELLIGCGELRPGRRLGRYELLVPVGRGGMAVVWAARQSGSRGFTKLVALKTLLPALSADPRFEKMFLAEARLAASLEHDNVCEVLDLGESDGLLYMVMEWVQGDSLAGLLAARSGPLEPEVAARIVLDVAGGLAAAHAAKDANGAALGIVHRDVSPQNILIGNDGASKIADFGIAKIDGAETTQIGYAKGKVRYMAPEQVYCEKVDQRTDVFALGVVLYEASTGTHPFAAALDVGTLAAIAAPEEARLPSELVADYPAALEAVVMRALAKDLDRRYSSMDELSRELASAIDPADRKQVAKTLVAACGSEIELRQQRIETARERVTGEGAAASIAPAAPRSRTAFAVGLTVAVVAIAATALVLFTRAPTQPTSAGQPAPSSEPAPVSPPDSTRESVPVRSVVEAAPSQAEPTAAVRPRAVTKIAQPAPSARAPAAPKASVSGRPGSVLETRE